MANKSVFMVSLNSKRLQDYLNEPRVELNFNEFTEVFVYDIPETLNGLFFNNLNIKGQSKIIENVIEDVNKKIVRNSINRKLIKYSEIKNIIAENIVSVYTEYLTNNSFKRHCYSQIFKNLQPKLREVGIDNHKSPFIEILTPFLLIEIAYYLHIYSKMEYISVYGLESEMEIITAIKNKKYPAFEKYLKNPVPHYKIEI